jgi:hypothetical protein
VSVCFVSVDHSSTLGVGTDESYALSVAADGQCLISAPNQFGVLKALESFSHLAGEACEIENAPVEIQDGQ